ncbi:hypothetical protein J6590_073502 [Homalodisca vitripennis]|nr:hypothetical protein J6590_073502 [Homalodisca vitripennis]
MYSCTIIDTVKSSIVFERTTDLKVNDGLVLKVCHGLRLREDSAAIIQNFLVDIRRTIACLATRKSIVRKYLDGSQENYGSQDDFGGLQRDDVRVDRDA